MGDGAHLGVSASRALGTILGGAESPGEEEQQSPQQVLARVLSAPLPGEGEPPYRRNLDETDAYAMVADSIARAFLVLEGEDPGVLDRDMVYPADFEVVELRGKPVGSPEHAAWEAMMKRWPGADEWLGGATGFQVGFAYNTALYVRGEPPVQNPAIVEIEVPGAGG